MTLRTIALGEVTEKPQYGAIAKGTTEPVGPLFIRQTDITSGRIDWSGVPYCDLGESEVAKYELESGDILISRLGSIGNVAVVDDPKGSVFAGYLVRFRAKKDLVDARFLGYQLQSRQWWQHVEAYRSGAVQPTLNAKQMAAYEFILPSLTEQRAIASVLGVLDDKIESNRRKIALIDELFQASWQELYSSLPTSSVRLSDLVTTQYGLTAGADPAISDPKFLRVKDINKRNWIDWQSVPGVQADQTVLEKYQLCKGDLLVARMADPGKSAIYDDDSVRSVFASYLVRLKPRSYTEGLFLYGFLKSPCYAEYVDGAQSGSVQRNMNARVMVDVTLRWPTTEQLADFSNRASILRYRINGLSKENESLKQLRDSLLPELLSGRARVGAEGV